MRDLAAMQRLVEIMRILRDPERGCAWDRAQTFSSIAPYTIEEAYEVADAIERHDLPDLREELGDLLLQVVFHAQLAEEIGAFDFGAVAETIARKMEARHPHVFASAANGAVEHLWEETKAAERQAKGQRSTVDGVALALPALMRAQKIQARAARDGFDWPDGQGPMAKLNEEIEELTTAADDDARFEEAGDLLFAAVNLVRAYGIESELALKAATAKFERRYRAMEQVAGGEIAHLNIDQQEELWQAVKRDERRPTG